MHKQMLRYCQVVIRATGLVRACLSSWEVCVRGRLSLWFMLPNFIYIRCLVIHVVVWSWYLQDPSAATWLALIFAWDVVGNVGCELFPLTWMLNKAIINPTRFDSKNYPIVILLLMLTQLSTVVLCVRFLCLDIRYDIFCSCKTPNNCDAFLWFAETRSYTCLSFERLWGHC